MLKPSIHAGFGIFGLCNWRCRSDMQTLKNYRIKRRKTAFEPSCLFFLKENEHRYCKYDKIWFPLNCINPCAFRHDWVTKKMSPNFFLVFMRVCGLFGGKTGEPFHRRCPKSPAPLKAGKAEFPPDSFRLEAPFLFIRIFLRRRDVVWFYLIWEICEPSAESQTKRSKII